MERGGRALFKGEVSWPGSRWRLERRGRRDSIGERSRSYAPYQTKPFSCARDFRVASAEQHSKISERAPRSGNTATLRTHQVESRHAGCATPGAFRHRKHAHERRARARLCQLIRRLALPACMKRSGAELPLCTWSGCGGRLNGVAVAIPQARWQWRRAPPRFVKMCQHPRRACCLQPVLPRPLGASLWGAACGASLWSAGCGTHVNWPCGGVRPREMRVECRRRPWKPNVNQ